MKKQQRRMKESGIVTLEPSTAETNELVRPTPSIEREPSHKEAFVQSSPTPAQETTDTELTELTGALAKIAQLTETNLKLGKQLNEESRLRTEADERLVSAEQLLADVTDKFNKVDKDYIALDKWADEQESKQRDLERQITILKKSKTSTEYAKQLQDELALAISQTHDPATRQQIITSAFAEFKREKQAEHDGSLTQAQLSTYAFPGGVERESLPPRMVIRMPGQRSWFKFRSGEVVSFLEVLEWRFLGLDHTGMAHYACLLEKPTEVNSKDYKHSLANGGATGLFTKLEFDHSSTWKLSVKGMNYHLKHWQFIVMEYLHREQKIINLDD